MYRIYSTEGMVLQSFDISEASKALSLFTRDFGLLSARAQGIRAEKSKLRYHLQDFSLGSFDLVRGKNGWRVTSARDAENIAAFPVDEKRGAALGPAAAGLGVIIRVGSLLTRLLRGEEKNVKLYADVVSSFRALRSAAWGGERLKDFEPLFVMRVLHHLGYWGEDSMLSPFLDSFEIEKPETLASFAPVRKHAIRRINEALKETQL